VVKWSEVPNASTYRIWRWNDDSEKKFLRKEVAANLLSSPVEPGYAVYKDNWNTTVSPTYSYQVEAVFYDATGAAKVSLPSPVGSAKSVPFLAPPNLRFSMVP